MSLSNRARLSVESLDLRIVPAVIDLTTAGSGATLGNGAIVHRNDGAWNDANGAQAHGRGAMNSFLSIDANGVEEGFNTTARPFQLDQVRSGTTALTLGQVPVVTVGGKTYREFTLDIQEPGSKARSLSVDEVRVYVANQDNLKNYNANNGKLGGQSPVFDLDSGSNITVMLRSMINQGNRVSEMALLVPTSAFAGKPASSFVYLYSKMGATAGAGAGGDAEHWGVRQGPPVSPPPPPANGSVSGRVFADSNQDGMAQTDAAYTDPLSPGTLYLPDQMLTGVTVQLLNSSNAVVATTSTKADGTFAFSNVAPGVYSIVESTPAGYVDGKDYPGGTGVLTPGSIDRIDNVTVSANTDSGGHVFTVSGGGVSGAVTFDSSQDQVVDPDTDFGIAGVTIHLLVLNDPNTPDDDQDFYTTTDANGAFAFAGLAAGTYTLSEIPPDGFDVGAAFHGAFLDGNNLPDPLPPTPPSAIQFDTIQLAPGQQDSNYNFTACHIE